jgi:AraC-like DNA-binding protein
MSSNGHSPSLQHHEAARFSNPLLQHSELIEDPRACASLLQEALPLMELQPLEPAGDWWFYGNNFHLGTMVAFAWTAKPMRAAFSDHHDRIALLGCGGELRLRQFSRTWRCGDGCCLLMAKAPCSMETSLSSGVAFALSDELLLQAALSMGGYRQQPEGWQEILDKAHGWNPQPDPATPSLVAALRQTLDMAGQLSGYGRGLLDSLQLDDQIYRLMAAMLLPDLREKKSLDRLRLRQREGRDAFDELIDYIKKNLHSPLTLTVLESRSHYSRRALQYAFAERMGCSATQFIKTLRLDQARRLMENPTAGDSVGSIAKACGYRSLGLFSVDFQQRFHVKPSQLLRESRPD